MAEIPRHQHTLNATKGGTHSESPTGLLLANQSRKSKIHAPFDAKTQTPMDAHPIGAVGNGQANNLYPCLAIRSYKASLFTQQMKEGTATASREMLAKVAMYSGEKFALFLVNRLF